MSSPGFFRLVFALYCLEAGFFFVTAPWLPAWERFAWSIPWTVLRSGALSGWGRGALMSFGLVHFIWVLHDFELYLRGRGSTTGANPQTSGNL